jgi:integrase
VVDRAVARQKAKEVIEGRDQIVTRRRTGGASLAETAEVYRRMPKRASEVAVGLNIARLRKIVELAWGRTLEQVTVQELEHGRLWEDYAAKRQGGRLDLSTRRHENRGINSALRCAVSMFHAGLDEGYRRAGIVADFDSIRKVQWVPEIKAKVPQLPAGSEQALLDALPELRIQSHAMWRAVMLARFAGLRAREIRHIRREWLEKDESGVIRVIVRDRPEEGFWHKTGADYAAPILSQELADDLWYAHSGTLVSPDGDPDTFFKRTCNVWIRQFIPRPSKGLHRLRALYLDHMRSAMASQIIADRAGIEAAQQAAGHTSSRTTTRHYLSNPTMPA